jgi:hypothetical protein
MEVYGPGLEMAPRLILVQAQEVDLALEQLLRPQLEVQGGGTEQPCSGDSGRRPLRSPPTTLSCDHEVFSTRNTAGMVFSSKSMSSQNDQWFT